LEADPSSVPQARRYVAQALSRHPLGADTTQTVLLLTSELVTNAVVHAGTEIELSVHVEENRNVVRVVVTDGSPNPPLLRSARYTSDGGRGLRLLAELADAWGTTPAGTGKDVWFEVRAV
jgi:anti-sigma regulatory factor (Ser/Thr protein kinase)